MNEIMKLSVIIKAAGEKMLSFDDPDVYVKEGHANFVTEADVAVQAFLIEELKKAFPEAAFMGEEEEEHHLSEGLTFVIDPIDGTTNYMRHRRHSVISVGAVEAGKAVFGAIYDPYHDQLYTAVRGQGAFCNGEQLHVANTPFKNALIDLGTSPYNTELVKLTAACLVEVMKECADIRRCGTAALDLCDVASGRADAYFEWILQPWDFCAGSLLVEEAGGCWGNITDGETGFARPMPMLAGSPECYQRMKELLQRVKAEQSAQ